jgi:hypothetical protein
MDAATTNNLNSILANLNKKLSCDSTCEKKKMTESLKQKWLNAEQNAKNSNEDIELAKKNYYIYTGGSAAYNSKKKSEYTSYTTDYENTAMLDNQNTTNTIHDRLERYEYNHEHLKSLNELLAIKLQKNKELANTIDEYTKKTITSERKVVYENHDMQRINTYYRLILFIYYGMFIYYLIFGNFFADKLYKQPKLDIILIIYIIFPYFLHYFVKKLFAIKNTISYFFNNKVYKNVYTNI